MSNEELTIFDLIKRTKSYKILTVINITFVVLLVLLGILPIIAFIVGFCGSNDIVLIYSIYIFVLISILVFILRKRTSKVVV